MPTKLADGLGLRDVHLLKNADTPQTVVPPFYPLIAEKDRFGDFTQVSLKSIIEIFDSQYIQRSRMGINCLFWLSSVIS